MTSSSPPSPSVVVSASWRDNSITAIARAAAGRGLLRERYVVDDRFVAGLALVKGGLRAPARAHAARARARSRTRSMPGDVTVGRRPELLRIVGAVLDPRVPVDLGEQVWKADFDRRVARRLSRRPPLRPGDVLVGMPGSSAATFAAAPAATRVLDAIDTHPREHNRVLQEAYPDGRAHAETYPDVLVRRIERELGLADLVLVPSELSAEQMRRHGVPADRIAVLPYAVDLAAYELAGGGTAPARRSPRPTLLCVAQVLHRKGIPMLLEAARRAPGVDVRVAGPVFDPGLVADVPDNVTLLGSLDPGQVSAEYAAADAFVLPSLDDCFGLVVTEAAAAGLPLYVTAMTGASEIVAALPQTTLVDPTDVAGLAAVLASTPLLQAPQRRVNAERTRELDRTTLDWERYADAVLDAALTVTR